MGGYRIGRSVGLPCVAPAVGSLAGYRLLPACRNEDQRSSLLAGPGGSLEPPLVHGTAASSARPATGPAVPRSETFGRKLPFRLCGSLVRKIRRSPSLHERVLLRPKHDQRIDTAHDPSQARPAGR